MAAASNFVNPRSPVADSARQAGEAPSQRACARCVVDVRAVNDARKHYLRLALLALGALLGCTGGSAPQGHNGDTSFAATQARGARVMGVDQYTSAHVFEDLPDGGRIILERNDSTDTAGIATIRRHMQTIAADFEHGDFAKPFQVHAQVVPGTATMKARRAAIRYKAAERPRGGEVRLQSADPAAVTAIHEFLAFQRAAHHAAAHEGMHQWSVR